MGTIGQSSDRPMGAVTRGSGVTITPEQADYPAKIHLCKVVGVNPIESTCELQAMTSNKELDGTNWATPFCTQYHGGGINTMPEEESYCYVAECSDGTRFIMGFVTNPSNVVGEHDVDGEMNEDASDVGPNFTALRDPMEPGDIVISTADENKIAVRRGGIVQVSSTSMAQRIYIPVENVIRDFFQRYEGISPLGEISWSHASLAGEDANKTFGVSDYFVDDKVKGAESTPVIVKYSIKDLAQEDAKKGRYTVEIRYGRLTKETLDPDADANHMFADQTLRNVAGMPVNLWPGVGADGPPSLTGILEDPDKPLNEYSSDNRKGVLSISIYSHDKGANNKKITYAFQINRDGNVFLHSKGHIHVEIDKTIYANVKQGIKIEYGDKIEEDVKTQAYVEFTNSAEFHALVYNLAFEAVQSMNLVAKHEIILDTTGGGVVKLGDPAADTGAVRFAELKAFIENDLSLMTAWGPTPKGSIAAGCTVPDDVESNKVLLRKKV